MSALKVETILIGGGVLVAGFLVWQLVGKAKGAAANATDAAGNKVTAYQNAGALGTAGAVANAASGGWLASLGETLGGVPGAVSDWWSPANPGPVNAAPPSTSAAIDKYQQGGNAASGSGSLDLFNDPAGFGINWGG